MFVKTKERKKGIVRDFPDLSDESLGLMAEDLGLYMSVSELKYCASQMKADKVKDITLDELYILDSLCSSANFYPEKIEIDSFSTNSPYIAETYTDFIKRRQELDGGQSRPVNLVSFLATASEYLYRNRKRLPFSANFAPSVENSDLVRLCGGLSADNDSFKITSYGGDGMVSYFGIYKKAIPFKRIKETDGNLLAIVIPHDGESMEEYEKNCIAFLNDTLIRNTVCNPEVTSKTGIIERISRYTSGFDVNIKKYPAAASRMCYADYAASLKGMLNFIISPSDISNVSQAAKRMKIRVFSVGEITSTGCFRIIDKDLVTATIKTRLLSSVALRSVNAVTVNRDITDDPNRSCIVSSNVSPDKHASLLVREYTNDSFESSDILTSVSVGRLDQNPFMSAMYASLSSVTKLVCAGADWRNTSVSCDIQSDGKKDVGALSRNLAAFLGLYRVQTELSVISAGSKADFGTESGNGGNIAVYASAQLPSKKISDTFVSPGHEIYLLTFPINDNGMPDFDGLRKFYDKYSGLVNEGKIISARTVAGKNVKETLSQMCSGNLTVEFDGVFSNAGLGPRLAVIAESKEPVDGIKIGTTALNASEVSDKNSVPEKKTGNSTGIMSKIYYPNVRVALVCFNGNTREQKILSDMFGYSGAAVNIVSGSRDRNSYDLISLEMRRSCITVFCGDMDSVSGALDNLRIRYASDEYISQGKLLISYGCGASEAFANAFGINIPDGDYRKISTSDNLRVYSSDLSSPFSGIDYSYNCSVGSDNYFVKPGNYDSLIKVQNNGIIYSDGFLSEDGYKAAFFSILTDEAVRSAVQYFQ